VFRGGTSQVRVDVTVLDKRGEPITNLTRDDFDLLEDGQPQSIDTVKLIEANGKALDDRADDMSLEIRSASHALAEAARDDVRVFIIFWDEYHIGQMAPSIRAREALESFVQTAFGPTDLVAVMDQLTPTDAIRFTRDRRALADQVHQLKGRQGVYVPTRSAIEDAAMSRGPGIEIVRAQVTSSALESTIDYLGSIKEGRKSILFVSQTIGPIGPSQSDTIDWLDHAIREANANNVTIYSLDPRGLDMNMRRSDVLISLANNTGGKQFTNNYPAESLKEIVKNASAFYLLGYSLWAGATPGAGGAPSITAVWTPRPSAPSQSSWLRASSDEGHVYFDGPFDNRVTFDAAAGTLHLRHQLIEADGSRSDRQESTIDVPDFKAPVAMMTPVLYRARTPLELRALVAATDPLPYAGRQFDRTDRVLVRFTVTGAGAADATVTAHLISKTGAALAALPLKTVPAGYELDLPLGSIAHGEYVISFEASHGADQAKQLLSFRVN
jgi:VWFA-related protein